MATESGVSETRYWGQEQRRRQFNQIMIGLVLIFTALNSLLNYVSIVDRRKIHEIEQVTQDRLNARAEIHITVLGAYVDNQRPLTNQEKERILDRWTAARYPEEMRPFLERIRNSIDPPPALR